MIMNILAKNLEKILANFGSQAVWISSDNMDQKFPDLQSWIRSWICGFELGFEVGYADSKLDSN